MQVSQNVYIQQQLCITSHVTFSSFKRVVKTFWRLTETVTERFVVRCPSHGLCNDTANATAFVYFDIMRDGRSGVKVVTIRTTTLEVYRSLKALPAELRTDV